MIMESIDLSEDLVIEIYWQQYGVIRHTVVKILKKNINGSLFNGGLRSRFLS